VLAIAKSFLFKNGELMEQISEVEPFISLNPINALFEPIDV
jgi:hypothetical protein